MRACQGVKLSSRRIVTTGILASSPTNDSVAIQFLSPGWRFDPKHLCMTDENSGWHSQLPPILCPCSFEPKCPAYDTFSGPSLWPSARLLIKWRSSRVYGGDEREQ